MLEGMMSRRSGYYLNGLRAWRAELIADNLRGVTRLDAMTNINHPDTEWQKKYLDLRTSVIGQIDRAIAEHEEGSDKS